MTWKWIGILLLSLVVFAVVIPWILGHAHPGSDWDEK